MVFDGVLGDPEFGSDLFTAEAFVAAHVEDPFALLGQLAGGFVDQLLQLFCIEQLFLFGTGFWFGGVGSFEDPLFELLAAEMVDGAVGCHPVKPGRRFFYLCEVFSFDPELQENILDQFFGDVFVFDNAEDERVQFGCIAFKDLAESCFVAAGYPPEKRAIVIICSWVIQNPWAIALLN